MAKNVPFGPLLSPYRVYQQGGQNQLYVIWPQTCIFKFENIALEPFLSLEVFQKIAPNRKEGYINKRFRLLARRVES